MKKKFTLNFLLFAFFALFSMEASAQGFYSDSYRVRNSGSFDKETSILSLQYGFGDFTRTAPVTKRTIVGPFTLKYERAVLEELGIAAYISPQMEHYSFGQKDIRNVNRFHLGFGAIAYYHFNKLIPVEKLDLFAGLGVGFRIRTDSFPNSDRKTESRFRPAPVFKFGGRWYFTNTFGVNIEFGYDESTYTQLGVSFRF